MKEPLSKAQKTVTAGASFITKITRSGGNNLEATRRLMQLVYRNFSGSDRGGHGVVSMDTAEDILKQELPSRRCHH